MDITAQDEATAGDGSLGEVPTETLTTEEAAAQAADDDDVKEEEGSGGGGGGGDDDATRPSEESSGRGSPDDWLLVGAVDDAEMDLALEAAGIGASLVAQVNGDQPNATPVDDDAVEADGDEDLDNTATEGVNWDDAPAGAGGEDEEQQSAVVVEAQSSVEPSTVVNSPPQIEEESASVCATVATEELSAPADVATAVAAASSPSVEEETIAALRDRIARLEEQLAEKRSDVQALEKQCVRLENRLLEAEAVAESGLACLGLTRDRMQALAGTTHDTLARLAPHDHTHTQASAKSPVRGVAESSSSSSSAEPPARLGLPAVMGDLDRAFAAVERATSAALVELQGHVVAADEARNEAIPEATVIGGEVAASVVATATAEEEGGDVIFSTTSAAPASRTSASSRDRIAVRGFAEGDVAMFFPTPRGDYVAFNVGAPHFFLSEESKALIGHDKYFKKVYVLGRIVFIERRVAADASSARGLPVGAEYFEVSVESVSDTFHGHPPLARNPAARGPPLPPHLWGPRPNGGHPPGGPRGPPRPPGPPGRPGPGGHGPLPPRPHHPHPHNAHPPRGPPHHPPHPHEEDPRAGRRSPPRKADSSSSYPSMYPSK